VSAVVWGPPMGAQSDLDHPLVSLTKTLQPFGGEGVDHDVPDNGDLSGCGLSQDPHPRRRVWLGQAGEFQCF
jgi:hypothetical protein